MSINSDEIRESIGTILESEPKVREEWEKAFDKLVSVVETVTQNPNATMDQKLLAEASINASVVPQILRMFAAMLKKIGEMNGEIEKLRAQIGETKNPSL